MLIDEIQADLVRLQLHPVNLSVSAADDCLVELHGSLLQYWSLPPSLNGRWLLAQLQELPDAAGPEAVMSGLLAAFGKDGEALQASQGAGKLRLFDPQSKKSVK